MTKIVFLDRGTFGPTVELVRPLFEHQWQTYEQTAERDVPARLKGASIAITNKVPIRRAALAELPDLKMISVAATGYDVIDIEACRERGIAVSNVRGYATNTVPEQTFALILALRRQIVGYRQDVIDGMWQKAGQFCFHSHSMRDLANATLGIMGEGSIGQSVARIGQAFGMRTLYAAHKGVEGLGPLYTPFETVLQESDIITLHSPLMPATRNMLALPEFRKMKRRPLIINTARGGLVNEEDLVKALDEGLVSGIGFDVLTKEPPDPTHPLLAIADRPNVIITPHVAWASQEAMEECWRQTVRHIDDFHRGQPTNLVT